LRRGLVVYGRNSLPYIIDELKTLCRVAGIEVICEVAIKEPRKISRAKMEEIKKCIRERGIDLIVVEPEVPPSVLLKIEKETGKEVVDRTQVILMVFESNAGTDEAKLQIRMARLRHALPLIRERVNMAKRGEMPGFMAGGIVATEKFYRHVRRMLKTMQRRLEELSRRRALLKEGRKSLPAPVIAIVGFANAGKTTFFNTATGLSRETGEVPFTTLSPKSYRVRVDSDLDVLLVDTVGFVFNSPPEIIEAFRSTLEELSDSDGLVLVIDSSEPLDYILLKLKEAESILSRLGSASKPILLFLNKSDLVRDWNSLEGVCDFARSLEINVIGCVSGTAFSKEDVRKALSALASKVAA